MTEDRKKAYRFLIAHAMCSFRTLYGNGPDVGYYRQRGFWGLFRRYTPKPQMSLEEYERRLNAVYVLADAFHNIAIFSVDDFDGFDEERFWRDVAAASQDYDFYTEYQKRFQAALAQFRVDTNALGGD